MRIAPRLGLALLTILGGCASDSVRSLTPNPEIEVAHRLNAMHAAAAGADADAYWACFAPDAVFLGTDDTERWTLEQFKAYANPFFAQGKGWTYTPVQGRRFIRVSADGTTAWFDEALDNETYGRCRGSGVLVRGKGPSDWMVTQYNLTFTVPNDLAGQITGAIKAHRPATPP